MKQKSFIAVITLVSINQFCYSSDKNYIDSIIKKYNIKVLKTNKLSKYVIDIFFKVDIQTFKKLKLNFKLFYLKDQMYVFKKADLERKKSLLAIWIKL